ncbi:MAG: hypothetical protein LKE28_02620 [Sphaerochaeta sp.]|nr:hypothetical protein [Sphaerochaeta sp.]
MYNRALFCVLERSPYTLGLEGELAKLSQTPFSELQKTALGPLFEHVSVPVGLEPMETLEVLPLNEEQRDAIQHGLCDPLTIITGPPGTGKPQVVTQLLVNCGFPRGKGVVLQQEQQSG